MRLMSPAFAALMFVALAPLNSALANDSEFYGEGATAYPINNSSIAMDVETLVIEQMGPMRGGYVDHWEVRVRYEFLNTTATPVTVQMGFPEHCQRMVEDMDIESPSCAKPAIRDFSAKIDGRRAKVSIKVGKSGQSGALKGVVFDRIHTFKVPFKANQRVVVEHRYTHKGRIFSPMHSGVEYILRTGGLWKGPIRDFDMRVLLKTQWRIIRHFGDEAAKLPKPGFEGWRDGSYQLQWKLKNFTPKADLEMILEGPVAAEADHAFDRQMSDIQFKEKSLKDETLPALRIMRNIPYALLGYPFKDKKIRAHFTKSGWYFPRADFDPKWLSKRELTFIRAVKAEEARR